VKIRIVVRAIRGLSYTNSASADASQVDPRPGNNVARSQTRRR
jgi:hypothetical protein